MRPPYPILCSKCLATCVTTAPGFCRCFSCGRQGSITETPEYQHAK